MNDQTAVETCGFYVPAPAQLMVLECRPRLSLVERRHREQVCKDSVDTDSANQDLIMILSHKKQLPKVAPIMARRLSYAMGNSLVTWLTRFFTTSCCATLSQLKKSKKVSP